MQISSINNYNQNFQARIKIQKPVATKLALGTGLLTTGTGLGLSGLDTVQQANWHVENIAQQGECYDIVRNEAANMFVDKLLPATFISTPLSFLTAFNLFKSAYTANKQEPKKLS